MNDDLDNTILRQLDRLGSLEPSPESTSRALKRVRIALRDETASLASKSKWTRLKSAGIAAAVMVAAAGVGAWFLLSPSAVPASFAEVQAALKAVHSVTCLQTTTIPGQPDSSARVYIQDNGLMRPDEADGSYGIVDIRNFRTLHVDAKKREAVLWRGFNLPQVNLYEAIKNLPSNASAHALSGKKIDGKEVLAFAVKIAGIDCIAWISPKTKLPVRIESTEQDEDGKISTMAMHDFQFDRELDAKLFTMEAPAGYTLITRGNPIMPPAPADPKLRGLVVTPLVGIGEAKFGMARDDAEKLLGKPDSVEVSPSGGAASLIYDASRGFSVTVTKTRGLVMIACASQPYLAQRIRDFSGKTDKGIAIGASVADVVRAYGEPSSRMTRDGNVTDLSYNMLNMQLVFFDDKLVYMLLQRP